MKVSELQVAQGPPSLARTVRLSRGLNVLVDASADRNSLAHWLSAQLNPSLDAVTHDTFYCCQPSQRNVLSRMASWLWGRAKNESPRHTLNGVAPDWHGSALGSLRVQRDDLRSRIAELSMMLEGLRRNSAPSGDDRQLQGTVLQDSLEELTERIEQCHARIKSQQARRDLLDAKLIDLGRGAESLAPMINGPRTSESIERLYARIEEIDAQSDIWQFAQTEIQNRRVAIRDAWAQDKTVGPTNSDPSRSRLRQSIAALADQWKLLESCLDTAEASHCKNVRSRIQELTHALDEHDLKVRHWTSAAELRQLRKCYNALESCCQQLMRRRTTLVEQIHALDPNAAERLLRGTGPAPAAEPATMLPELSATKLVSLRAWAHDSDHPEFPLWQIESMRQQRSAICDALVHEEAILRELVCRRDSCMEQMRREHGNCPPSTIARIESELEAKSSQLAETCRQIDGAPWPTEKLVGECLETASRILHEVTQGQWTRIDLAEYGPTLVLTSMTSHTHDAERTDRAIQSLVALCLSLAMPLTMLRRGSEAPVLFFDPFVGVNNHSIPHVVKWIGSCVAKNLQVIVVLRRSTDSAWFAQESPTMIEAPSLGIASGSHRSVLTLADSNTVRDRALASGAKPARTNSTRPVDDSDPNEPIFRFPIERTWMRADSTNPPTSAAELAPTGLSFGTSLRDAGVCAFAECLALEQVGVRTVRQLLDADPESLADRISDLRGDCSSLRKIRACCWMLVCIPGMSIDDARILYDCDIRSPQDLDEVRGQWLLDRIQSHLNGMGRGDLFENFNVERINGWMRALARTRPIWKQIERRAGQDLSAGCDVRSSRVLARSVAQPATITLDQASQSKSVAGLHPSISHSEVDERSRYYLHLNDSVDAAPSISARMVQQLAKIGVRTVRDLLSRDAEAIAAGFEKGRTSADTVRLWQRQARLSCTVPNIRRHDAQILAACGIEDGQQLAALASSELMRRVDQLAATKSGQRMMRNLTKPDLAEIERWILGAAQRRSVQAA